MKYKTYQLILLSLIFHFLFFISLGFNHCIYNPLFISPDTLEYIQSSKMLFDNFTPHPTRPMGFAFLIGIPYFFLKEISNNQLITYGIILNILFNIASFILVYKSISKIVSSKFAYWITIFSMCSIGLISVSFELLTESITSFLLVLISYLTISYNQSKNPIYLSYGCSVLIISSLIRPVFFYISMIGTVLIFFELFRNKTLTIKTISPIIICITLILIQIFSMYRTYGNFTISYIDKLAWYYYLGARTDAPDENYLTEYQLRKKELSLYSWNKSSKICTRNMKKTIKEKPIIVFKTYITNLKENISGISNGVAAAKIINPNSSLSFLISLLGKISKIQNLIFTFLLVINTFLYLFLYKAMKIEIAFLLLILNYIILTSGISFLQGDRFNVVMYLSILILSVYHLSLLRNNSLVNHK